MRGDLDVENEVSVLEFYVSDRPALHKLFPGHGIAGTHGGGGHRMSEIRRRGIIRLIRERRGHLILVVRIEVGLGVTGMVGAIGLCLPVVFVVVMVGMIGRGRWRVIWNDITGRRLVVKRIVLLVVSHGFKGGDWLCSTERGVVVDKEARGVMKSKFFVCIGITFRRFDYRSDVNGLHLQM